MTALRALLCVLLITLALPLYAQDARSYSQSVDDKKFLIAPGLVYSYRGIGSDYYENTVGVAVDFMFVDVNALHRPVHYVGLSIVYTSGTAEYERENHYVDGLTPATISGVRAGLNVGYSTLFPRSSFGWFYEGEATLNVAASLEPPSVDSTTHVIADERQDLKLFGVISGSAGAHVRIDLSTSYIIVNVGPELSLRSVSGENTIRESVDFLWGVRAQVRLAF